MENDETHRICIRCGHALIAPLGPTKLGKIEDDPAMRLLLPVGRSGLAIAAGYTGLFAVTLVFAPVALILGILAIVDIRRHPEKMGMGRAVFGLVMGLICSLILLLLLVSGLIQINR